MVSTYFTFTHYLETLKHVDQLHAAAVVLNPEPFDAHPVWFSTALDWSMVFSERSRDEIVEKGISRAPRAILPLPHQSRVPAPHDADGDASAAAWASREEPFTVLLFFGAEGTGPGEEVPRGDRRRGSSTCRSW